MTKQRVRTCRCSATTALGIVAIMAVAAVPAYAQNDLCADAIAVAVPSSTAGTTVGATADAAPTCGTTNTAPGVWYSVTGTGNTMTASLCNAATTYDTKLSVYTDGCGTLTCVVGNDDFCGLQSQASWCSDSGVEYLILVHGFSSGTGPFQLDVSDDGAPCAPPPDTCADAEVITTLPFSTNVDNSATGPSAPPGSCNSGSATMMQNDVWYTWTAPSDCLASLTVNPTNYDGLTAVYSGPDCNTLTEIACGDEPEPYTLIFAATMGTTYWFQSGDWGTSPGGGPTTIDFDCAAGGMGACCDAMTGACTEVSATDCLNAGGVYQGDGTTCTPNPCPQPPTNDTCATAEDVGALPANVTGNNSLATDDVTPFCGTSTGNNEVWYTVTGTGNTITASTCNPGTDFDTKLQVFCGTCLDPICIGGNDDATGAPPECDLGGLNRKSIVTWCSNASTTYYIVVSAFGTLTGGNFELTVTDDGVPCAAPIDCTVPTGACCEGAVCRETSAGDCAAAGGTYLGNGTVCTPDPCGTGACCLPDGSCLDTSEGNCILSGGAFEGNGTMCATTTCPPPPPPNDNCANAALLVCDTTVTVDNTGATTEATDPAFSCHFGGASQGVGTVWYQFVATDTDAYIATCNSVAPADDTLIGVYSVDPMDPCNTLVEIACSEDDCNGLLSEVCATGLTVGNTYYVQIASFSDSDRGVITVDIVCPCVVCDVVCTGTPENEPDCGLPTDTVNGGCNSTPPVFSTITCGETVCGTGAFDDVAGLRDTDWWQLDLTGAGADTYVTWTVTAEFPVLIFILTPDPGADPCGPGVIANASATADECVPVSVSACLSPGIYWLFAAPQFLGAVACGAEYEGTVTCGPCPTGACCEADGSCTDGVTAPACAAGGGAYQGDGSLCSGVTCPQPVPNDDCPDAIALTIPADVTGNNTLATVDVTPTCGTSTPNQGMWYTVTGTGNTMTATTCNAGTDFDTKIQVLCGTCVDLICVGGNDDAGAACALNGLFSTVTWCSNAGTTYYILVGGFGTGVGNFQLTVTDDGVACTGAVDCTIATGACCFPDGSCMDGLLGSDCTAMGGTPQGNGTDCMTVVCPAPPPNDNCADAIAVTDGVTAFDNSNATDDGPALPAGCDEGFGLAFGSDIWYCYTATCGGDVTVSLCGSLYDTRMAIYSPCSPCPTDNSTFVACNDDAVAPSVCVGTLQSEITFPATAGAMYLIRVGGYAGAQGTGTMTISCASVCTAPVLQEARSVATHDTGEFYVSLDITDNPATRTSESRNTGIRVLDFVFDQPILAGSVSVNGGLPVAMVPGAGTGGANGARADLGAALTNNMVYTLTITASTGPGCDLTQDICVVAQVGDFNDDDIVSASDKGELLGFVFQTVTQLNAKYDLQVGGGTTINTSDVGAWTGFFGNNASASPCP